MSVYEVFLNVRNLSQSDGGVDATYLCDSKAEVDDLGCHCEGGVVLVIIR